MRWPKSKVEFKMHVCFQNGGMQGGEAPTSVYPPATWVPTQRLLRLGASAAQMPRPQGISRHARAHLEGLRCPGGHSSSLGQDPLPTRGPAREHLRGCPTLFPGSPHRPGEAAGPGLCLPGRARVRPRPHSPWGRLLSASSQVPCVPEDVILLKHPLAGLPKSQLHVIPEAGLAWERRGLEGGPEPGGPD